MSEPTTLYRMFGSDRRLLYVGVSCQLIERLRWHSKRQHWWSQVARIDLEVFPDRRAALIAEKATIKTEAPLWNLTHVPSALQHARPASTSPRDDPASDNQRRVVLDVVSTRGARRLAAERAVAKAVDREDRLIQDALTAGATVGEIARATERSAQHVRNVVDPDSRRGRHRDTSNDGI